MHAFPFNFTVVVEGASGPLLRAEYLSGRLVGAILSPGVNSDLSLGQLGRQRARFPSLSEKTATL